MVVRSPPFQVCEQVWGLLGRGPRTASERGNSLSDRQIHPFNKGSIEPSREA
jgi:hypothetical protein